MLFRSASGGEAASVSKSVSFFNSPYDLQPDTITNCAINNSGTPITTPILINTDINAIARSAISPDMGAYEFSYTLFVASAGNNSPVCSGSLVSFTSDPGTALNPTFSWTAPNASIVSTTQNPAIAAVAGIYIATVTDANGCIDTASTVISLNTSPTGRLSGPSITCAGNPATLSIAVTGNGTITGSLNTGDVFSGAAPTITLSVAPFSTTTYYITDFSDGGCTSQPGDYPDTVKIRVTQTGEWTGVAGANWNDGGNWCGGIPATSTDVIIAAGAPSYPVISSAVAIHNIDISSGASLINNSVLQIAGSINNAGTFNASGGSIAMNGSSAQTIPASAFVNNNLLNLIISNNTSIAGPLNLTGLLSFASSNNTLSTNGLLTLKSTATNTAMVSDITLSSIDNSTPITGNSINGAVTVERYIGVARRSWRFLTIPVTGQSIRNAWGGAPPNSDAPTGETGSYGTIITGHNYASGSVAVAAGFDWFTGLGNGTSSSIRYYTPFSWASLNNTPDISLAPAKQGYMLYVRGDRLVTSGSGTTTLRATGLLKTGRQTVTVDMPYTVIGNPYAAAINLNNMYLNTGNIAVIERNFWVWDASIGTSGGYVALSWNIAGHYDVSGGNQTAEAYLNVKSSQAFFVKQLVNNTASINIEENNKNTSAATSLLRPMGNSDAGSLQIKLYDTTAAGGTRQADGVLARFNNNYQVAPTELYDVAKLNNFNENFSLLRDGRYLSIESRPFPEKTDTLFLPFWGLRKQLYKLKINGSDLGSSNQTALLIDQYTKSQVTIGLGGDTTIYQFGINSDTASFSLRRLMIIMEPITVLPVYFISVTAAVSGNQVQIKWSTGSEAGLKNYTIERSTDGSNFSKAVVLPANNLVTGAAYQWVDIQPNEGINYYRIKSISSNGTEKYSEVVHAKINKNTATQSITIYGNTVKNNIITMQLNNIEKGNYQVKLFNMDGQLLKKVTLQHNGGNVSQSFSTDSYLPSGKYQLQLSGKLLSLTVGFIKE